MTEPNEATGAPKTLLGLGPPDPPEESCEVALEKADAKDAPAETLRAWSTSRNDYDALTKRDPGDDLDETLPFGIRHARRRRAFVALVAIAVSGTLATALTLHGRSAPRLSPHATSKPATKLTVVVGGPWVLRALEDVPEERSNEVPEYLRRTVASPTPPLRGVPSPSSTRNTAASAPRVESNAPRAQAISDSVEGAPAGNPDRIRAVADSVHLEDDDDASESAGSAAGNP